MKLTCPGRSVEFRRSKQVLMHSSLGGVHSPSGWTHSTSVGTHSRELERQPRRAGTSSHMQISHRPTVMSRVRFPKGCNERAFQAGHAKAMTRQKRKTLSLGCWIGSKVTSKTGCKTTPRCDFNTALLSPIARWLCFTLRPLGDAEPGVLLWRMLCECQ